MPKSVWFATLTILSALALCVLVSSQHRMRLIAGTFVPVDSLAELPMDAPLEFMSTSSPNAPSFDSIVRQLAAFETAHPLRNGDALPAIDQPDTCERLLAEGRPIHCYNADIGVCSMLAREGVRARMWDMTGPWELGGDGHNLLEVFDPVSSEWKALDPYYHSYFVMGSRNDSTSLASVPALRLALLERPGIVKLVRYVHVASERPDANVLAELRFLAPGASLHANNNFRERYDTRYSWLMPLASVLDRLPLRIARGVRTLMLGAEDQRYLIEDSHSPHYSFWMTKVLFWSLFILTGTFLILTLLTVRDARTKNRVQTSSRSTG